MQKLPPVGAFINKGNTQIWLYILVIFYLAIPQHQVQLPAPIQPQAKPLHQFTSNINISGSSMIACAIARRCASQGNTSSQTSSIRDPGPHAP